MSHWNYRLIKFKEDIEICEVYYEKGRPVAYCEANILGESLEAIRDILRLMKKATHKPILSYKIFLVSHKPILNYKIFEEEK